MSEIVPIVPGKSGNTKQISPSKHWCFTVNNHTNDDITDILEVSSSDSSIKHLFQEETGENGTPHLQGLISFSRKVRPKGLFKNKAIHWEKCRDLRASIRYCQKKDTRTGKIWNKGYPIIRDLNIITDLRPWQQKVVDILGTEPDGRTIHWFWEYDGAFGKTALTRYIIYHYNAVVCAGKASDIKHILVNYEKSNGYWPDIVICDIPRANLDFISYTGLEEIIGGVFASTKYESESKLIPYIHLICFANEEPKYHKMSADRWNVVNLREDDTE